MPGDTLRTFVALALDEADAGPLARWAESALGEVAGLRLVPAANLHATLVFCGSVARERAPEIVAAVEEEATGEGPFRLMPERVKALGSVVAVVYRTSDPERLAALQDRLAQRLVGAGLAKREERPWLPHVTVARARGRGVRLRLPRVEPPSGDLSPSGVAAYTTVPVPGGVTYRPLALIGLRADTTESAPRSRGG